MFGDGYHSSMTVAVTKCSVHDLLEEADSHIEAGRMLEASETLWRAADSAFQAAAEAHGWPVDRHRRNYDIYNNLRTEVDVNILRDGVCAGSLMRQNLLEGLRLDEEWFALRRNDIRTLVDTLQVVN